ncbi:MAG: hypothetical protein ACLQGU_03950 [bacterium]
MSREAALKAWETRRGKQFKDPEKEQAHQAEEDIKLELVEALRSLNEIVMEEEPEDLDEESKDEKLSDEE